MGDAIRDQLYPIATPKTVSHRLLCGPVDDAISWLSQSLLYVGCNVGRVGDKLISLSADLAMWWRVWLQRVVGEPSEPAHIRALKELGRAYVDPP